MGIILDHPRPVLVREALPAEPYFDSHEPIMDRDELKKLLALPLGEHNLATVAVRPFAGELIAFPTPDPDPEREGIVFQLKRCGVKENTIRQNLSSTVRYVNRDESGDFVTERDYPVGDMTLSTVKLGLADWNLADSNGVPLPINEENIQVYMSPLEFQAVYDRILEINPMWGRGEATTKKS